ncbi:MAG: tetraacyldisaccharide 4'-kinase [Synergistaceae bacterium]|jgi:tetraacyldisaccharide 4'-kinase|nr:tetraacyldisaccharide 4'-kinase [Synergistaceae bacterium]
MNFVRGAEPSSPLFFLWTLFVPAGWIARLWIGWVDFLYRHGLKRVCEPPIPVISVGNLTYGGTNKTPFVEMLCRAMLKKGLAAGIVSRGYGGDNADVLLLKGGRILEGRTEEGPAGGNARRAAGDEPLLLSSRLPDVPVAVSRDRMKGLRELARRGVCLAVADDAFQHRRITRDADIVLIDATCPFGNERPIPAGILREPLSALKRAHIVVVTKADQAGAAERGALLRRLTEFVPEERVFYSRLTVSDWAIWRGGVFCAFGGDVRGRGVMAFSAIGNPAGFTRSLAQEGVPVLKERHFLDHHAYSEGDMESLLREKSACGAEFLTCTEKDIYNLPPSWREVYAKGANAQGANAPHEPLLVPRVSVVLEDPDRFERALVERLRPRIVVASNGYGEDAVGVLLAKKLRGAFPEAEVMAFPLVGRGEPYTIQGFPVVSTPSVTPSGGVLKYRLRDLWGDLRAGLFGHIRDQQGDWRAVAREVRTPLCVGDVYLLLHTLWGQGTAPLFVATAKTVHLSGHWKLERFIIRRACLRTWTRDGETAAQLAESGADAVYAGSPIMDLLEGVPVPPASGVPARPRILLLPGSRARAYDDVKLLLGAVESLQARKTCDYVMGLAPTIDLQRLTQACEGWRFSESEEGRPPCLTKECLTKEGAVIRLHLGGVAEAAAEATLLIGLGGTANQLCAGMGVPVISIDEKGKRVQKKLLADAEILTEPTASALAAQALKVLTTPALYRKMSDAGRVRMGSPGALDDVVSYAARELGWKIRCSISRAFGPGPGMGVGESERECRPLGGDGPSA